MNRLSGKVAAGIGGVIARRFAAERATVYATSRRADEGETAHSVESLRARRVDAADEAALNTFFNAVRSDVGRLDPPSPTPAYRSKPLERISVNK